MNEHGKSRSELTAEAITIAKRLLRADPSGKRTLLNLAHISSDAFANCIRLGGASVDAEWATLDFGEQSHGPGSELGQATVMLSLAEGIYAETFPWPEAETNAMGGFS